jgi:IS1 family transposase
VTLGNRSAEAFSALAYIIRGWDSFWYVTDGYSVYPMFLDEESHIVSFTYMTRIEGENTRLRHYASTLTS